MNDRQQLAAMGEHMREMAEYKQKRHSCAQIMAWAGDYEKEGGHALIVEMLKSYAELLSSPQCNHEFKAPDGWRLVPASPTAEMLKAASELPLKATRGMHDSACYRVMLAAAPEYNP